MKNLIRISIIMAIVLTSFTIPSTGQAALISYNSGFRVQNLENATASIFLYFYDRTGVKVLEVSDSISPNDSKTYFPISGLPANFDGSGVVSSSTKVAAIVNVNGSDGVDPLAFGASYAGVSFGSNNVGIPLLMKGNYGYNTWFSVQNVGGVDASVTVNYSDGISVGPVTVKAGSAAKFDQAVEAHAPGWVGSATVTSTGAQVAVTILEIGPKVMFAFNGFPSFSKLPAIPLVNQNNAGYVTGIQVQNLSGASTTVRMDYIPSLAGSACYETRTIPAGQSITFGLYAFTSFADPAPGSLVTKTCTAGSFFVGAGRVTSNSGNADLAVIVSQLSSTANKGGNYNGFDPNAGTATVVFPIITDRSYGFGTGWSIMNVGGAAITAASLTCTVIGKDGANNPINMSFNPPANLAINGVWTAINQNNIANGFVGAATCVGPVGSKLVGIAQQVTYTGLTDTLYVYEGVNIAP